MGRLGYMDGRCRMRKLLAVIGRWRRLRMTVESCLGGFDRGLRMGLGFGWVEDLDVGLLTHLNGARRRDQLPAAGGDGGGGGLDVHVTSLPANNRSNITLDHILCQGPLLNLFLEQYSQTVAGYATTVHEQALQVLECAENDARFHSRSNSIDKQREHANRFALVHREGANYILKAYELAGKNKVVDRRRRRILKSPPGVYIPKETPENYKCKAKKFSSRIIEKRKSPNSNIIHNARNFLMKADLSLIASSVLLWLDNLDPHFLKP
ncbi:tyrosine--tRNA ligase 2 [Striga asiatica]|uniref:Tyrosine--tRNA ligase 2 n=1 Tax=Striga asiatica TaxID=4170 RepID=A0A5A7Q575_STRAF|nr:tyrosine--tRNA ligase 2 [Striga asiatica]